MPNRNDILSIVDKNLDSGRFRQQHWEGSFYEYLDAVTARPQIARNAFQRIYDMILHFGTRKYTYLKEEYVHYNFFDDPIDNGQDGIFGLDSAIMRLVDVFKSAARGYGSERRILLLHGPVGSSKSTLVRLVKKGLEHYSQLEEGALYTFAWKLKDEDGEAELYPCPMHEEPLKLIPRRVRAEVLATINVDLPEDKQVRVDGDLDPFCRRMFEDLLLRYGGDWRQVVEHVTVRRLILSEKDRRGVGTFQPKDEKNQDSTELTGDINYRKIAQYGSDSDPRAFNFDGELNIANRGLCEFIEVLKLDVAFLYDLLGASQEHTIKPKKFAQTDIDEVIIGHTNEPEYKKLQSNELMEAFRDRTIKIDIPYNTRLSDEIKIYDKDFGKTKVRGIHIAPHTIEMAAMWAVLTRLEEPKKAGLTLMQKLKLYDGKNIPGYTEDSVRELRGEARREGMQGISPRYIQDKVSNCLVSEEAQHERCINPFMVLNEIEEGLSHHSLLNDDELKKRYIELLSVVRDEYEDILKAEVQRAISADEDAINRLATNYIENVRAYTQHEKVRNKFTGREEEPDERLMRSIEEKIDIPESRKEDFRHEIMNYIGALALDGKKFEYHTNARLHKALELKLFEDSRDTIKLKNVVSGVIDDETQAKIDVVKQRLIKFFGYNETSATDVLNYVASIFARGDAKKS
ncbi:MAG: PrkA family serine protein kinase [Phycisphaerae bacterium]